MKNNTIYAWVGLLIKRLNIKDQFEINCLIELASNCKSANSFFNCVKSLYSLKPDIPIKSQETKERSITLNQYDNSLSPFSKSTLSKLKDDD